MTSAVLLLGVASCELVAGIHERALAGSGPVGGAGGAGGVAGTGGLGAGGVAGTGGLGSGGTGGAAGAPVPVCGDGIREPGELCLGTPAVELPLPSEAVHDLALVDCNEDGHLDAMVAAGPILALVNGGAGDLDELVPTPAPITEVISLDVRSDPTGEPELLTLEPGKAWITRWSPSIEGSCELEPGQPVYMTQGSGGTAVFGNVDGNDDVDLLSVVPFASPPWVVEWYPDGVAEAANHVNLWQTLAATDLLALPVVSQGVDDLLVLDSTAAQLVLLRHDGSGYSAEPELVPDVELPGVTRGFAGGDLDDDGDIDLVVTVERADVEHGDGLAVLRNQQSGDFSLLLPMPTLAGNNGVPAARPRGVALGDMDGDGDLDAAVVSYDESAVAIFLNDGEGELVHATRSAFPSLFADSPITLRPHAIRIALGDLNGDEALDIVVLHEVANPFDDEAAVSVLLQDP